MGAEAMPMDAYFELTCSACGAREMIGPPQMLERLHAAGMLKREKEPDWELVRELFRSSATARRCEKCGSCAVVLQLCADAEDDDWGDVRCCEQCGATIPAQRLEIFPDTRLCVACRQTRDRGVEDTEPEYCPRCGSVMQMRLSRSSGISRYVMHCGVCGR
jgi:hypothetical protein